jgi:hypothetical protein
MRLAPARGSDMARRTGLKDQRYGKGSRNCCRRGGLRRRRLVCHCAYRYDHEWHSGTETAAEAIARHRFAIQPGGEVAGLMVQLRSSRK